MTIEQQYAYAYAVCRSYTDNHDDTMDLVQSIMLKAWQARNTVTDSHDLWFKQIVRNACIDRYRHMRRYPAPCELVETDAVVDNMFGGVEAEELVRLARMAMNDDQWRVVALYAIGYETAEIAQIMGRTEGSVKALAYRGRENARRWREAMA